MFPPELIALATNVLAKTRAKGLMLTTAESCTGGLIAGLLTEIPGSSDVVDRGFVTYSNTSKVEMLGVPEDLVAAHGAVSAPVAKAMAAGALQHSKAQAAVAVTGIAGPGGGTTEKPVGLVFIAAARGNKARQEEHHFGDPGRTQMRLQTVEAALRLLDSLL